MTPVGRATSHPCSSEVSVTMEPIDTQATQDTDPVCGMQVDKATVAGASEYHGHTQYFCSTGCKRQFDQDPVRYAPQPPTP